MTSSFGYLVGTLLLLASCVGSEGPARAMGATGAQGAPGAPGTAGSNPDVLLGLDGTRATAMTAQIQALHGHQSKRAQAWSAPLRQALRASPTDVSVCMGRTRVGDDSGHPRVEQKCHMTWRLPLLRGPA